MRKILRGAIVSGMLGSLCGMFAGCTGAPIQPAYTQADEQAICERQGGWWHPDNIGGRGFCESQGTGPQR